MKPVSLPSSKIKMERTDNPYVVNAAWEWMAGLQMKNFCGSEETTTNLCLKSSLTFTEDITVYLLPITHNLRLCNGCVKPLP